MYARNKGAGRRHREAKDDNKVDGRHQAPSGEDAVVGARVSEVASSIFNLMNLFQIFGSLSNLLTSLTQRFFHAAGTV